MTLRKFLRDYGSHLIAVVGLLVAVVSIFLSARSLDQSDRALALAEQEAQTAMFVSIPMLIDEGCAARIEDLSDGAVLKSLAFWSHEAASVWQTEIREADEVAHLGVFAHSEVAAWVGYSVPNYLSTHVERVEIGAGRGPDGQLHTYYAPSQMGYVDIPLLMVSDVEMRGIGSRQFTIMILRVGYVYAPLSEGRYSERANYYLCMNLTPHRQFADEQEAMESFQQERAAFEFARSPRPDVN